MRKWGTASVAYSAPLLTLVGSAVAGTGRMGSGRAGRGVGGSGVGEDTAVGAGPRHPDARKASRMTPRRSAHSILMKRRRRQPVTPAERRTRAATPGRA